MTVYKAVNTKAPYNVHGSYTAKQLYSKKFCH